MQIPDKFENIVDAWLETPDAEQPAAEQKSDTTEHATADAEPEQKHSRRSCGGWRSAARSFIRGAVVVAAAGCIGAVVGSLSGSSSGARGRMN